MADSKSGRPGARPLAERRGFPSLAPLLAISPGGGIEARFALLILLFFLFASGCATAPGAGPNQYTPAAATYHAAPILNYGIRDNFAWPVRGSVISAFGDKIDFTKNKGIDIRANYGTYVKAAKSGTVVFCDDQFKGFGRTIIIDHGSSLQTVYSYNSDILVKVGDSVRKDQAIAKVGKTGRAREPSLHFEVRKNGEPQNPYYYLSR